MRAGGWLTDRARVRVRSGDYGREGRSGQPEGKEKVFGSWLESTCF